METPNAPGPGSQTITGASRLFMVVADPVAQLRSPQAFNARFARDGRDAVMVAAHVARDDLAGFIAAARGMRNLDGLVVTIPHKEAVTALCDDLGPEARRIGSVNVIRRDPDGRLTGENFDGTGFAEGLLAAGHRIEGRAALLIGSGGAASAIAFALLDRGLGALDIWNRTRERAEDLARRLHRAGYPQARAVAAPSVEDRDLIVNATSLGMAETDPLPLPVAGIGPRHLVAEVVMSPPRTPLLRAAAEAGAAIHPGQHMLDAQLQAMGRFIGAFEADSV